MKLYLSIVETIKNLAGNLVENLKRFWKIGGLVIVLIALPVVIFLVTQTQIFKSRAALKPVEFTGTGVTYKDNRYYTSTTTGIKLKLTSPFVVQQQGAQNQTPPGDSLGIGKYGTTVSKEEDLLLLRLPPNSFTFVYVNANERGDSVMHTINPCSRDPQPLVGCVNKGKIESTDTVADILDQTNIDPTDNKIKDINGFKKAITDAYKEDPRKQYWTVFNEPEIVNPNSSSADYEPSTEMGGNSTQADKFNKWLLSNYDTSNKNYTTNPEQYVKIYLAYYKILYDAFEGDTSKFTLFFPGVGTNANYWKTFIPAVISAYHKLYPDLDHTIFPNDVLPVGAWTFHAYPGVDANIAGTHVDDVSCNFPEHYNEGLEKTKGKTLEFINFINGLNSYNSTDIWITEWGWISNHADDLNKESPLVNSPCVSKLIVDVVKFLETDSSTKTRVTKVVYFPSTLPTTLPNWWSGWLIEEIKGNKQLADPGKIYSCLVNKLHDSNYNNCDILPLIPEGDNLLRTGITGIQNRILKGNGVSDSQWITEPGTYYLSGSISGDGQIWADDYVTPINAGDRTVKQYTNNSTITLSPGHQFAVVLYGGSGAVKFSNVSLVRLVPPDLSWIPGAPTVTLTPTPTVAPTPTQAPVVSGPCNGKNSFDAPVQGATLTAGTTVLLGGWSTFCSGPNGTNRDRVDIHKCDQGTWNNCSQVNSARIPSVARPDVVASPQTCGNLNPNDDGWNYNWVVPNTPGNFTLREASINDSAASCVDWGEKNITIVVPENLLQSNMQNTSITFDPFLSDSNSNQKIQWFIGNDAQGTFTMSGNVDNGGLIQIDEYKPDNTYVTSHSNNSTFTTQQGNKFAFILRKNTSGTATFSNVSLTKAGSVQGAAIAAGATASFKIAKNPADLPKVRIQAFTSDPMTVSFSFDNPNPPAGYSETVFVQFINTAGKTENYQATITYKPTTSFPATSPFTCNACAADIVKSANNRVDAQDNALLTSCFGKSPSGTLSGGKSCSPADINRDGVINQTDVDCLKSVYFKTCTARQ